MANGKREFRITFVKQNLATMTPSEVSQVFSVGDIVDTYTLYHYAKEQGHIYQKRHKSSEGTKIVEVEVLNHRLKPLIIAEEV